MLANKIQVRPTVSVTCPRCTEEVYSLGAELKDYLGQSYLDLGGRVREAQKNMLKKLATRYFENKKEITNLINADLNRDLAYFYENGGPIIEPPVTEQNIKDIEPFFYKAMANFFSQLDAMAYIVGKGEMSVTELERETYQYITGLFNIMGRLYQNPEVRKAFNELIRIEMNHSIQH
ncbi:hypothetical protein [Syntrophomonas curvata]